MICQVCKGHIDEMAVWIGKIVVCYTCYIAHQSGGNIKWKKKPLKDNG